MRLWSALSLLAAFAGGTLLGPVVISSFSGLISASPRTENSWDEGSKWSEAQKLVQSYRNNLPQGFVFRTIITPPEGRECGYNTQDVFPGGVAAMADERWSNYRGYLALNQWRNNNRSDAWISAITQRISEEMSVPKMRMLKTCIDASIFRSVCMHEVKEYSATIDREGRSNAEFSLVGTTKIRSFAYL